ncbi:hypothetical protein BDV09DRAFT_180992 [Aspergillus tetrazonus]
MRRSAPVARSQSRMVGSSEADTTVCPSGDKATTLTQPVWPCRVRRSTPMARSQSRTVWSSEADAIVCPSGENATAPTLAA